MEPAAADSGEEVPAAYVAAGGAKAAASSSESERGHESSEEASEAAAEPVGGVEVVAVQSTSVLVSGEVEVIQVRSEGVLAAGGEEAEEGEGEASSEESVGCFCYGRLGLCSAAVCALLACAPCQAACSCCSHDASLLPRRVCCGGMAGCLTHPSTHQLTLRLPPAGPGLCCRAGAAAVPDDGRRGGGPAHPAGMQLPQLPGAEGVGGGG